MNVALWICLLAELPLAGARTATTGWVRTGTAALHVPSAPPGAEPAFPPDILPAPDPDEALDLAELEELLETPIVESASRRAQPIDTAPASITVLTAEQIEATGSEHVAEVLRLVPGVHVAQTAANNFEVGMRGVSELRNNRTLVMVDGRIVYEPAVGRPIWSSIPLQIGEIDRIEVVRGPSATLYGANAMSGMIAIKSKRPIDHPGWSAHLAPGLQYLRESPDRRGNARLANSGRGYVAYNAVNDARTLGVGTSFGFNLSPEFQDLPANQPLQSGYFGYYFRLTGDYRPNPDLTIFSAASVLRTENKLPVSSQQVTTPFLQNDEVVQVSVEHRRLFGESLRGFAQIDGRRVELVGATQSPNALIGHGIAQVDWSVADGSNVLTLGVESYAQRIDGLFGAELDSFYSSVFVQDDLRLFGDRLYLSGLARLERVNSKSGPDEVVYENLNPRLSAIVRLNPEHSLRLTGASAFRTPTSFENFTDIDVRIYPPPVPPVRVLTGNRLLDRERSYSLELGYRGAPHERLRVDVTAYVQKLIGLTVDSLDVFPQRSVNGESRRQIGVETAIDFVGGATWTLSGRYAFVHNARWDGGGRLFDVPAHLAGLSGEIRPAANLRFGGSFDLVSAFRRDFVTGLGAQPVEIRTAEQYLFNLRAGRSFAKGRGELYLSLRNVVGFFRDPRLLTQYPSPQDPIGGTILIGVLLRGL